MIDELFKAIDSNDLLPVAKYAEDGGDINIKNGDDCTLLHAAVEKGHFDIASYLIGKGALLDTFNSDGFTPLLSACDAGDVKMTALLLGNGCNTHFSYFYLPMHVAAAKGKNEVLKLLFKRGLDINEKDRGGSGTTPLYWAVQEGFLSTVKLIVRLGGDLNFVDDEFATLLYTAAGEGHTKIAEYLLSNGADIEGSPNSCSPLVIACCFNHYNVVVTLVEHGANIESTGEDKRTPLFYAVLYGRKKIAQYLAGKGANIHVTDSFGYTLDSLKHKRVREIIENET